MATSQGQRLARRGAVRYAAVMCAVPWGAVNKAIASSLPLVIAGVVAYIAWAQYQINRRQYRLTLFEKRMAIYAAVTARCAAVVNTMTSDLQDNIKFLRETRDHEFLFGPEVGEFINAMWQKGNKLHAFMAVVPRQPNKEAEIVDWFNTQLSEARKFFAKYMDFTDAY